MQCVQGDPIQLLETATTAPLSINENLCTISVKHRALNQANALTQAKALKKANSLNQADALTLLLVLREMSTPRWPPAAKSLGAEHP